MLKIRTLIVDDEPFARQKICNMLRNDPDVEIVGECENGWDALAEICEQQPDLVFMDMLMPEKSGLEVLRELDERTAPHVVFITAHNDFALQAFETHALDYLLKPFDYSRFQKALHRARTQIQLKKNQDIHLQLNRLMRQVSIQTG
ncbi:MAG: response regulator, partial [Calditrichaeota bacterium]|nr:response regulator [Calditrichota bacterium]